MAEVISGFESILASLSRRECRDEGVILALERMLRHDSSRLKKVLDFFEETTDEDVKEILATLIVKRSEDPKYRKYLIEFHGWQDEDF